MQGRAGEISLANPPLNVQKVTRNTPHTMSITSLAHVCLRGPDLDSVTRFYCGVLGLKKQFNFVKQGKIIGLYLKIADNNFIEVFQADNPHESDRGSRLSHFCLETDCIETLRKSFVDAGYDPGEIKMGADQSYQFWIEDPTGVFIEFHQYTPDSSQTTGKDVEVNW